MTRSRKNLLFASIGAVVLLLAAVYGVALAQHQNDTVATVVVNDKVLYQFNLADITDTRTYTIGPPHAQNVIEVSPQGIAVISANCPDQTCVKQGHRQHGPKPIVCLPHHLSIRFSAAANNTVDATTGT